MAKRQNSKKINYASTISALFIFVAAGFSLIFYAAIKESGKWGRELDSLTSSQNIMGNMDLAIGKFSRELNYPVPMNSRDLDSLRKSLVSFQGKMQGALKRAELEPALNSNLLNALQLNVKRLFESVSQKLNASQTGVELVATDLKRIRQLVDQVDRPISEMQSEVLLRKRMLASRLTTWPEMAKWPGLVTVCLVLFMCFWSLRSLSMGFKSTFDRHKEKTVELNEQFKLMETRNQFLTQRLNQHNDYLLESTQQLNREREHSDSLELALIKHRSHLDNLKQHLTQLNESSKVLGRLRKMSISSKWLQALVREMENYSFQAQMLAHNVGMESRKESENESLKIIAGEVERLAVQAKGLSKQFSETKQLMEDQLEDLGQIKEIEKRYKNMSFSFEDILEVHPSEFDRHGSRPQTLDI